MSLVLPRWAVAQLGPYDEEFDADEYGLDLVDLVVRHPGVGWLEAICSAGHVPTLAGVRAAADVVRQFVLGEAQISLLDGADGDAEGWLLESAGEFEQLAGELGLYAGELREFAAGLPPALLGP